MTESTTRPDVPKAILPLQVFFSELIGTGVLLLAGLSVVILCFGAGSPVTRLVPNATLRMVMTGFLFGSIGAAITLSPVGRISGAHINPAVTLGFLLAGKLRPRIAFGYVVAQLGGAALGSAPLLLWGEMGRSVNFGASLPGPGYSTVAVLLGEVATTFGLVAGLCIFLATRELRRLTPFLMPILYGIMVPLESRISGTSTNPARTLGPAIISGNFDGWWIYWVGPLIGTVLAILACSFLLVKIEVAKLYHFTEDRAGVFKLMTEKAGGRAAG
ncbi:MAG: aquaporin [Gemmatimonadota bacterium]|nr:aquaporin [Gemmatimonadota bacterium]